MHRSFAGLILSTATVFGDPITQITGGTFFIYANAAGGDGAEYNITFADATSDSRADSFEGYQGGFLLPLHLGQSLNLSVSYTFGEYSLGTPYNARMDIESLPSFVADTGPNAFTAPFSAMLMIDDHLDPTQPLVTTRSVNATGVGIATLQCTYAEASGFITECSGVYTFLDPVSVPEPSSGVLLGLGIALVADQCRGGKGRFHPRRGLLSACMGGSRRGTGDRSTDRSSTGRAGVQTGHQSPYADQQAYRPDRSSIPL